MLPSQVAQHISRDSVKDAYTSFFESRKSNRNAKAPKYLNKDGFYPLTWKNTTFSFLDEGKTLRLSLGRGSDFAFSEALRRTKEIDSEISKKSKYYPRPNFKKKTFRSGKIHYKMNEL